MNGWHRFGSGLNRHAHLHAAVTDGVFLPGTHGPDGPPAFLPTRPLTQGDLAALTERVRRRVIACFKRQGFLDAHAAADMLAWENSGFSIDASVRITLLDRDVPSYFQSLEHLLRYCARPPFALERLSVIRDADGRIARIRYVMPRHWVILWAATWVGPGRKRKSTQPGASGVIELSPSRVPGSACGSDPAATQAPASLSRRLRAEPPAADGRHGTGGRECRKAAGCHDRRARGRPTCNGRLLQHS